MRISGNGRRSWKAASGVTSSWSSAIRTAARSTPTCDIGSSAWSGATRRHSPSSTPTCSVAAIAGSVSLACSTSRGRRRGRRQLEAEGLLLGRRQELDLSAVTTQLRHPQIGSLLDAYITSLTHPFPRKSLAQASTVRRTPDSRAAGGRGRRPCRRPPSGGPAP